MKTTNTFRFITFFNLLIITLLCMTAKAQQQTPAPAKAEQGSARLTAPDKTPPKLNADGTMQIEITLGELREAQASLNKLFSLDLPIKTALGLGKTRKAVAAELEGLEEQRLKLVKKHIPPGEKTVPPERMEAFFPEYNALVSITVKLTITPVSLATLGDSVKLSVYDMARLEPFLIP